MTDALNVTPLTEARPVSPDVGVMLDALIFDLDITRSILPAIA